MQSYRPPGHFSQTTFEFFATRHSPFPDFENNGWRLDAEYTAPMPEALRGDLAQFFAPHNELLFAWTGERLDWPAH